jgi:hypothetical protein
MKLLMAKTWLCEEVRILLAGFISGTQVATLFAVAD